MRILLVDDEFSCLEDLAFALEPAGFQVSMTTSPGEALTLAAGTSFDVIITDMRMPIMTGVELARKLREITSAKIIFLSAFNEDLDGMNEPEVRNARAVLAKPVDFFNLLRILRSIERGTA